RAAGSGPGRRGGRGRRVGVRGGQRTDRGDPAGPGRRAADPQLRGQGRGRRPRLPPGDRPGIRRLPARLTAPVLVHHETGSGARRPQAPQLLTTTSSGTGGSGVCVRRAARCRMPVLSTAVIGTATSAPRTPASTTPVALAM